MAIKCGQSKVIGKYLSEFGQIDISDVTVWNFHSTSRRARPTAFSGALAFLAVIVDLQLQPRPHFLFHFGPKSLVVDAVYFTGDHAARVVR